MITWDLIPKPSSQQLLQGKRTITNNTVIVPDTNPQSLQIARYLQTTLTQDFNLKLRLSNNSQEPDAIKFKIVESGFTEESYQLEISDDGIVISAISANGLFYGVQTLRQLLETSQTLQYMKVSDSPRFKWRGMNFDCCRHFFDKSFVKRYIDLLAYYKMNVLHWHLTEDQGWRIEIKKYPNLTKIGAWRKDQSTGKIYGGFYTQEDVKEIVQYAAERFIQVIPEIELPGHCVAALASYPELSCTGGPFEVANTWGIFEDVYCAGNDKVFEFLENVLTEVIDLFPSNYIHIGGDEVPKKRWQKCPKCQKRIQDEKLKDEKELQSYFIKRISKFLKSKNKKLIGWDEILEGGLASDATVQSWRGVQGAVDAVKQGHDAIVSPTSHAYFDYPIETTDLLQVHSFDPIPKEIPKDKWHHILGGECCCWTEYMENEERVDYMMFPRLLAMSEVLWSVSKSKDYAEFLDRAQLHRKRLDRIGVKYGPEAKCLVVDTKPIDGESQLIVSIYSTHDIPLKIYYTTDGSDPTNRKTSNPYSGEFKISQSTLIKACAYRNALVYGKITEQQVEISKATGRKYKLKYPYSPKYPAKGDLSLVSGLRGSTNYRVQWQGFLKNNLDMIIDLESVIDIKQVIVGCLQSKNLWIFYPKDIEVLVSHDGLSYRQVAKVLNKVDPKENGTLLQDIVANFETQKARYVQVIATSLGTCPDWHPGAGKDAWLFVDQVIIN